MKRSCVAAGVALLLAAGSAHAQMPPLNFDQAAYITCKEAHAMTQPARRALAEYLAEHSARYRGVVIPEGPLGEQIGYLVRGGCTLAPDAYLFTVIDRAIVAEQSRLPKRQ
ncbi:MAG: hypothetical protein ACOY4R_00120 [Pseudomonadota bacterium]